MWKLNKRMFRMVPGYDVGLAEVTQLSLLAFVGKFGYLSMAQRYLG